MWTDKLLVRSLPLSAVILLGLTGVMNTPTSAWASPAESGEEIDLYNTYRQASLNLSPVAQILAWVGYLRLHPDSHYRDDVRWKIRYLAVMLSPEEEEILLAALAFEQLYDQVLSQDEPAQRISACGEFIKQHPALLSEPATTASYVALLERLGVEDPQAFIALHRGLSLPPPSIPEAPVVVPADPVLNPPEVRVETLSPPPPLDVSPPTPVVTGSQEHVAEISHSVPEGDQPPPPPTEMNAEEKEALRYPRWQEATRTLGPEASIQLWTTYLLLYPDTTHRAEVEGIITRAMELDAEQSRREQLATRQLAQFEEQQSAQLAEEERMKQQIKDLEKRQNRRLVLMIGGGLVVVLVLLGL